MKASEGVVSQLNLLLCQQLTAINQYFLHARMLRHWGVAELGERLYHESICQMKYADDTIARTLLLEGLPNLQKLDKLFVGQSVVEILECDLRSEQRLHDLLSSGLAHFESVQDYVSRDLYEKFKARNEEHIDFLETQLDLAKLIGTENYIQSQMHDD